MCCDVHKTLMAIMRKASETGLASEKPRSAALENDSTFNSTNYLSHGAFAAARSTLLSKIIPALEQANSRQIDLPLE